MKRVHQRSWFLGLVVSFPGATVSVLKICGVRPGNVTPPLLIVHPIVANLSRDSGSVTALGF